MATHKRKKKKEDYLFVVEILGSETGAEVHIDLPVERAGEATTALEHTLWNLINEIREQRSQEKKKSTIKKIKNYIN